MLFLAILAFGGLVTYGLRKRVLQVKSIFLGFIPFLLSLIVSGLTGFFGWKLILKVYPHYMEIQQGFTYNVHAYIALIVRLAIAICFGFYHRYSKIKKRASLLVAPLFFWFMLSLEEHTSEIH